MSNQSRQLPDDILATADEKSCRYEWEAAAELYRKALEQIGDTQGLSKRGLIADLAAASQYNGAFQSPDRPEFTRRMRIAKDLYDLAADLYEKSGGDALSKRSKSRGLFATFWLERDSEARRDIAMQCVSLSNRALQSLKSQGENVQAAKILKEIVGYSRQIMHLATDWGLRKQELGEILENGRKAATDFENIQDNEAVVETLHNVLWAIAVEAEIILEPSEFKMLNKETASLAQRMLDASAKSKTPYVRCLADETAGDIAWDLDGDLARALTLYRQAATYARQMNDQFTLGRVLAVKATLEHWVAITSEYSEARRQAAEDSLRTADEAINRLEIPLHTSYLARSHAISAGSFIVSADSWEIDTAEKRALLVKAIEVAKRGMSYEAHTVEWYACAHEVSKGMYLLAAATSDINEKKRLLQDALPVREETVRVTDILQPYSWNRGVMRNYLALIKADLASIEQDPEAKSRLLEEAVSEMKQCLDICARWSATVPGSAQRLARYSEWYGDILHQLYSVRQEPEIAETGARAYLNAIEYLNKHGQIGPIPAIRWKLAKLNDALGRFKYASQDFLKAADEYRIAATKVPGTSSTFNELASYMDAWAEIERARLSHVVEEYTKAYESYSMSAKALQKTTAWAYLSKVFIARSLLERGEAHSSDEKHEASASAFQNAVTAFGEARLEIESKLQATTESKEEVELKNWLEITGQRESYARGRIALEEARAFDKKGRKAESSRKYESASEIFRVSAAEISNPQDRGEMETLALFCEAWAKMKEAESHASPEIYSQAAETFTRARETASRETFRLLALANASICRALASGTKFRHTRNIQLYSDIKRELETAADYYEEAGFRKTASWTRATQRLFDALLYLADAEVEQDPKKKAEFYNLAEKLSEQAAKLYGEAGFSAKKREALKHSGRAREEKTLLIASIQDLSQIPTASGSIVTAPPTGRGQPLGLERFEDANVIGNLSVPKRELNVGTDLVFELEMANVGRTTATLIKLENIAPDGFEIEPEKNPYRLVDGHIDMRGRRLEHLKMHEMKIVLNPTRKGKFDLHPRILFSDDKGNFKMHEFSPVQVEVQELGISGWLRGPGKKETNKAGEKMSQPEEPSVPPVSLIVSPVHLPPEFQFETERGKDVFQYLVRAFVDDYMSKRLYVEKSGWRTLMDLVRHTGAPRSAFYGPSGKTGAVLAELERRGLAETRIFPEEPGRGGEVTKARIAYDNQVVRRIVDKAVMENP